MHQTVFRMRLCITHILLWLYGICRDFFFYVGDYFIQMNGNYIPIGKKIDIRWKEAENQFLYLYSICDFLYIYNFFLILCMLAESGFCIGLSVHGISDVKIKQHINKNIYTRHTLDNIITIRQSFYGQYI